MSYRLARIGVAVACVAVLAAWGCRKGPTRVTAPGISATAGADAIKQYDTDGDQLIGDAELDKAPALKSAIENLDTDKDGKVSADEITALIRQWQESKLGRMGLSVVVHRRGQPLAGATVKFVPEEFLGPEVLPAQGTTDEQGIAQMSVAVDPKDPKDVPGVQCGLYRVEITKEGVDIPAAYNTQTTLGQEVSQRGANIVSGIVYEVQ
jgi:hypothetical protein